MPPTKGFDKNIMHVLDDITIFVPCAKYIWIVAGGKRLALATPIEIRRELMMDVDTYLLNTKHPRG